MSPDRDRLRERLIAEVEQEINTGSAKIEQLLDEASQIDCEVTKARALLRQLKAPVAPVAADVRALRRVQ